METYKLILIPLIGFIIGYFTNYIAIKMLFYPRKKILGYQGLLPRRKKALAKNLSEATIHILPEKIKKLEKIPFIGENIINTIKNSIEKEINKLDDIEMEKIVLKVANKELKFITWIGGLIGLIIGLAQVLIILI